MHEGRNRPEIRGLRGGNMFPDRIHRISSTMFGVANLFSDCFAVNRLV